MDKQDILQRVDHTILTPEATWAQVQSICDEALWAKTASVCLSPCYVAEAAAYLQGEIPVCTVLGFPHGTVSTVCKCYEAERAIQDGARELDMVINLGWVKDGRWDKVKDELAALRKSTAEHIWKEIIEACLLTQEEKTRLCHLVSETNADYIKTSTGFSTGGASLEDVRLFQREIAAETKIKAAGGIRSFEAAEDFLEAGADRIGSSALVKIARE